MTSPSLQILEQEYLSLSWYFWLPENVRYWLYTIIYPFHLNFTEMIVEFRKVCHIDFVLADENRRVTTNRVGRCVDEVLL